MLSVMQQPTTTTVRYFREHISDNYINIIACYARDGDIKNMEQVLQYGFDINTILYSDNTTLLVHAILENQTKMCQFLIENGANVNIVLQNGDNLLIMCLRNPVFTINLDIFKMLVDAGCDMKYIDYFGNNVLYYAIPTNHIEAIEYMIQAGLNININLNTGKSTPLHLASLYGHYDLCVLFVEYGADILAENIAGKRPSGLAIHNRKLSEYLKQKEDERILVNQIFKRGRIEEETNTEEDIEQLLLEDIEIVG